MLEAGTSGKLGRCRMLRDGPGKEGWRKYIDRMKTDRLAKIHDKHTGWKTAEALRGSNPGRHCRRGIDWPSAFKWQDIVLT